MTTQINYAKVLHATRHATGGADPITPTSIGAVPASRTVAGKALSSNVTVAPADLTGATTTGIAVMTATDAPTALTALGAAPTASPTLTGTVIVPTAAVGTNSTVAASTAFAAAAVAAATLAVVTTASGSAKTLALADGDVIECTSSSAVTVTVPLNSAVAFPIGRSITVRQYGTGQVTLAATSGVTLNSRGALFSTAGRFAEISLMKRATDEWIVVGDLA